MSVSQATKWVGGIAAAGAALLMFSFLFADRQLADTQPPLEVTVPRGDPLGIGALVFASNVTGSYELYLAPADGSASIALTADDGFDSWRPRVSPDRSTILFYRSPVGVFDRDATQASLWMIGASGGAPIEIVASGSHSWSAQGGAEWAPNGTELAMTGGPLTASRVWITSVDGRDIRSVSPSDTASSDPSWSPDGRRLLYSACVSRPCEPNDLEVFAVPSAGGSPTRMTLDEVPDTEPRFSPDGSQIVMRSVITPADEDGDGERVALRLMPTNRSSPAQQLTDADEGAASNAIWRNNRELLFDMTGDLYSINLQSGAVTAVVQTLADERYPAS